jgi:hypothetical protein
MITKHNWLNTNIGERLLDKSVGLKLNIKPYKFKNISFDEATDLTCFQINNMNKEIYVALSGGYDSEYVLRSFCKNNVCVTPIIVKCGRTEETKYAYQTCNELKLQPIVIDINETDFLNFVDKNIVEKFDAVGYNSAYGMIAAEYVSKIPNSILISGEHFLGDGFDLITDEDFFISHDWDFYIDNFLEIPVNINFFMYNIEIVYSVVPTEEDKGMTWAMFKYKKFNLKIRDKMRYHYTSETQNKLNGLLRKRKHPNKKFAFRLTKSQFYDCFEKYKEI